MVLKCAQCRASVDISDDTARRYSKQGRSIGCPACTGRIRVTSPSLLSRLPWKWLLVAAGAAGAAALFYYFSYGAGAKPVTAASGGAGEEPGDRLAETKRGDAVLRSLVESGAVKPEDLVWLLDAGEYRGGVIGMSSRRMDWEAAQGLAVRVGAEILEVGTGAPGSQEKLLAWLAEKFPGSSGIPQWGLSGEVPQVVEVVRKSVVPAPVEGGRRPVLLHWKAAQSPGTEKSGNSGKLDAVPGK